MYRAVGWKAVKDGVALDDEGGGRGAGAAIAHRRHDQRRQHRRCGCDARHPTPEIDQAATAVARLPAVRTVLVEGQRQLGAGGGIVMEGRDIGTVVFPDADVKIYLDASADERARAAGRPIRRIQVARPHSPTWRRALRPRRDRPHAARHRLSWLPPTRFALTRQRNRWRTS